MTVTLDVGLVPSSEDTLFVGIFCWCQVWSRFSVVEARNYWSWSSKKQFLAFIPYRLRTNERKEETSISFSCMPSVVKDWLPFSTRSCTLGMATHFPIRFKLVVLWHPVNFYMCCWETHKTRHHVLQQWNECRNVTFSVDRWCVMAYQDVRKPGEQVLTAVVW
jgi:hypothetical protein